MNYYLSAFKKYAVFSGRATRAEFWYFVLFHTIVYVGLLVVDTITGTYNPSTPQYAGLLSSLYLSATFIPFLALGVRRLHDIGRSGWLIGIYFVLLEYTSKVISLYPEASILHYLLPPILFIAIIILLIVLLIFFVMDSKEDNQYGPNPKKLNS